ncbi:MAG: FlgD immunoglobulin-like domain containing protein [Candidatus Krumholzibacteriaceae bacterium]|jgi:hypothetical protein
MKGRILGAVSMALLGVLSFSAASLAGWIENGVLVCGESGRQFRQEMVSDGHGGAVIAWSDDRTGGSDIYAQRVDAFGLPLWQTGGVPICAAAGGQSYLKMAPDASGGTIAVWIDSRAGGQRLYIQRIDGSGVARWATDGILLSSYFVQIISDVVVPDGYGGAIVAWSDKRSGDYDLFAQRIDADGNLLWGSEGITVAAAPLDQFGPTLLPDGAGGAIVLWDDNRTGVTACRAQRIDGEGGPQWAAEGVPCGSSYLQGGVVSDGAGGAFVAGLTYIPGEGLGSWDNSVQVWRIGSNGALRWAGDVTLAGSTWEWPTPGLVPDGCGGVIVVWDGEGTAGIDIRGQRLDSLGAKLWGESGVVICDQASDQVEPHVATDGAGGAVISYQDNSVYGQRIDPNGNVLWETNGVSLCGGTSGTWPLFATVVSDGAGGEIAVWCDKRGGAQDIYAGKIDAAGRSPVTGIAGGPPPARRLLQNFPNPFNPSTTIPLELEKSSHVRLTVHDSAGRLVAVLLDGTLNAGRRDISWDGKDRFGREAPSGVYFCRLAAAGRSESTRMVLAR